MATHSNRPKSQDIGEGYTLYRLDGATMEAGYIADLQRTRLYVVKDPAGDVWPIDLRAPILNIRAIEINIFKSAEGTWVRLFDRHADDFIGYVDYRSGPLTLRDGLVCHPGAAVGCGFSAGDRDLKRVGWR